MVPKTQEDLKFSSGQEISSKLGGYERKKADLKSQRHSCLPLASTQSPALIHCHTLLSNFSLRLCRRSHPTFATPRVRISQAMHTKEEQGAIEHSQHIRRLKHYDLASHQEEGQHIVPQRISQPASARTTIDEELAVVLHPSGAFQRRQLRQGWL